MTKPASVRVTIDVGIDHATAFDVFTAEIDAWYKRGRHHFYDDERALAIRFEPFVGGRLIEVYDLATGEGREMARVTAWEPGHRLMFVDGRETEVEVLFVPDGDDATRVTLEHRGLERLAPDEAEKHTRFGWQLTFRWYDEYVRNRTGGTTS